MIITKIKRPRLDVHLCYLIHIGVFKSTPEVRDRQGSFIRFRLRRDVGKDQAVKKSRPNLDGCPRCGHERKEKFCGFLRCAKCEHVFGSAVVGADHWDRITIDGRLNAPDADAQNRAPRKRGRDYVGVDRMMKHTLGELETKKR